MKDQLKNYFESLRNQDLKQVVLGYINDPSTILENSFIRYLIIGFSTFGIDFGTLYIIIKGSDIEPTIANAISTLIGIIFNFTMSNFWTFKAGKGDKAKKLSKYSMLATFNYFFGVGAFAVLHDFFDVGSGLSKVIVTGMVVCWNFLIYKFWIFVK